MLHVMVLFFFGLLIGAIAKWIVPGRDPGGWLITSVLGIAGSFVGSWLGEAAGLYQHGQPAGWAMSVVGAVVILVAYRAIRRVRQD